MKSGKSGIQYRNSEATGLGYYLVMQKNEIATWRQVKRSTVQSSTAARQLNTRKIMQSPLLKSKDRTQTHIDYLFSIVYSLLWTTDCVWDSCLPSREDKNFFSQISQTFFQIFFPKFYQTLCFACWPHRSGGHVLLCSDMWCHERTIFQREYAVWVEVSCFSKANLQICTRRGLYIIASLQLSCNRINNEWAKQVGHIEYEVRIFVARCSSKKLKHHIKEHPLFEYFFKIGYIIPTA